MSKYTTGSRKRKVITVRELAIMKRRSMRLAYNLHLMAADGAGNSAGYKTDAARALRVLSCSTIWEAYRCPTCGQLHSTRTWGCHHRLCPLCSMRASRATATQAQLVMGLAKVEHKDEKLSYALLTLTQRNVSGAELAAELDRIIAAWSQLRYIRHIRRHLAGWARSIEITVAADGSYHPHLHAILMLRADAPTEMKGSMYWRQLWAQSMGTDYTPICDCRPVKDAAAVFEVSKYVTKVSKLLETTDDALLYDQIKTIDAAIYGRRLRSYGGLWLRMRRELAMRDAEDMSDIEIEAHDIDKSDKCDCGTPDTQYARVALIWAGMEYKIRPYADAIDQ